MTGARRLRELREEHGRVLKQCEAMIQGEFGESLHDGATLVSLIQSLSEEPEQLLYVAPRMRRVVMLLAKLGTARVVIELIEERTGRVI